MVSAVRVRTNTRLRSANSVPSRRLLLGLRRLHRRARRPTLKTTREGKILLGIALAVGFAAMNTGNNLLFFGWGLLLSSILVSGVLSDATLWSVTARGLGGDMLRAGDAGGVAIAIQNPRMHLPAYGVDVVGEVRSLRSRTRLEAPARFQLRLKAQEEAVLQGRILPTERGDHILEAIRVSTKFPFGFFTKTLTTTLRPARRLLVFPRRIATGRAAQTLVARFGDAVSHRVGPGDEFFSLRPYRDGDDPRHVAWRRSARVGRWYVRETEQLASQQVTIEFTPPRGARVDDVELAIAYAGSLAEDLLAAGQMVGIRGPGFLLPPGGGARQRERILVALARCEVDDTVPVRGRVRGLARVAVVAAGWPPPADVDAVMVAAEMAA